LKLKAKTLEEIIRYARDDNVVSVDLKFVDLIGRWHHVTVPASYLSERLFKIGIGFDASQNPGYKTVEAGDMNIVPDPTTAQLDPFWEEPCLSLICDLYEADSGERFGRDPRALARRAEVYLASLGDYGDLWLSPEFEFHILDNVYYASEQNRCLFIVNAPEEEEGSHVSAAVVTPGYTLDRSAGYHVIPPLDEYYNLRTEMVRLIEASGIPVKYHHHEMGGSGQCEIEVLFNTLTRTADDCLWVKYLVRNAAYQAGYIATFMPKPIYGEAGNGMHVHQYLGGPDKTLFYEKDGPTGLSDVGRYYVGGLLKHGRSLAAFTNPSTNSYKRLTPGYEAPVQLFYSRGNRSATVRIPEYAVNEREMRIEYRPSDATANPYLMFAAMLMAGLDGVANKIDPGDPVDEDPSKMSARKRKKIPNLPKSLVAALDSLEADYEYLLAGGVFTEDIINAWIETKMEHDVRVLDRRPHPHEYVLYFDM
jgi:glutamine synthetase